MFVRECLDLPELNNYVRSAGPLFADAVSKDPVGMSASSEE